MFAEFEEEWMMRIKDKCPGEAVRIQQLILQDNFKSCVQPLANSILRSDEVIPNNIARALLGILVGPESDSYVSTLIDYQKRAVIPYSSDILSQWIALSITPNNVVSVRTELANLHGSSYKLWIIAKITGILNASDDLLHYQYSQTIKEHRISAGLLAQWIRKGTDRETRKGLRILGKLSGMPGNP